jgi:hypothetical protein
MGVSANWKVQLQRYRIELSSWRFLICHLLLLPCTLLLPPPSATATTALPQETDPEAHYLKVFAIVIVSRIRRWTQVEVDKLLLLLGVFTKGFLTMGFQVYLFIHMITW